ncbi:MAG: GYDIA family GHMP kinase [Bacteroidota bacterium]
MKNVISKVFSAHGKLLLTGEYLVLDGAKALAIPTRFGQQMRISTHSGGMRLSWTARDHQGKNWFHTTLSSLSPTTVQTDHSAEEKRLLQILQAAAQQSPRIWETHLATRSIETTLDFDRNWGLGTSSTLISLLAQYLEIDPYRLLADTFGGSGYDLACAVADKPILYVLEDGLPCPQAHGRRAQMEALNWQPGWLRHTYFVYLDQKQNSRAGIRRYRERGATAEQIKQITNLTGSLIGANSLIEAQSILKTHEEIISHIIDLPPVQQTHFPDFPGVVKSLGAWGGDFVWALTDQGDEWCIDYFKTKGYKTVLPFIDMILDK